MAGNQSTSLKFNILSSFVMIPSVPAIITLLCFAFFGQGVLLFWEMRRFHMRMDNVYSHFHNNGHV
jgi:DNA-binding transcriptional regulator of glucitol operon